MHNTITVSKEYLTWLENRIKRLEDIVFHNRAEQMDSSSDETKQGKRALKLLNELGPKLEDEVERQGLTEEQLYNELKQTRKKVFQGVYGDSTQ